MKKVIALIAGVLLAPLAQAQTETGTSAGAEALDISRSGAISAGRATAETVTVTDYKTTSGKEVVVVEEEDKWWSVNASTGFDSLYMFRGVNLLGEGNPLYWLGGDVGVVPWENGAFTAGVWYGTSILRYANTPKQKYGEWNLFANYAHSFGAFTGTVGYIWYYYTNFGDGSTQNEIFLSGAYDIEVGSVTLTPNITYYFNVGPNSNQTMGWTAKNASYLLLQLDASVPLVEDLLSLEPYAAFGVNFGFNASNRNNGGPYAGGNNYQMGVAMPFQVTDWFSISPYGAVSYQWQQMPGYSGFVTAPVTWWWGMSANVSF